MTVIAGDTGHTSLATPEEFYDELFRKGFVYYVVPTVSLRVLAEAAIAIDQTRPDPADHRDENKQRRFAKVPISEMKSLITKCESLFHSPLDSGDLMPYPPSKR